MGLIDTDVLIKNLEDAANAPIPAWVRDTINAVPTVQAEKPEITTCKDCRMCVTTCKCLRWHGETVKPDDFCSKAVRIKGR